MGKIIEPLRGVHDVLAESGGSLAAPGTDCARSVRGIRLRGVSAVPIIEQTQLFKRSIGDFTDIVEEGNVSFVDLGEDHITLRPEATAGIVRAVISNGLLRENRLRVVVHGAHVQTRIDPRPAAIASSFRSMRRRSVSPARTSMRK